MQKHFVSVANNNSYDELQSACLGKQELTIHEINKIKKGVSFSKKKKESLHIINVDFVNIIIWLEEKNE